MSDRRRTPSPMAYPLSCRSSPDPTAYERYPRSDSPDDLLNSSRLSLSFGEISNNGSDRYSPTGRRDSLLSFPSPRQRDYSDFPEQDVVLGVRAVSPSLRSGSHEEVIANHRRVSRLQQDLMTANKKIGRMDSLYEETNKRKMRLQEELLEACTKVARLEATCGSYQEKETQLQQEVSAYRQQNSKLELDVLSAFKKVSQLESELATLEEKRNGAQREHIAAQERVSMLEAVVEKMKEQQSSKGWATRVNDFTISRKMSELEAMNERYSKENEELRQEVRRVKSKTLLTEDELNRSLIEKASLNGKLSQAKEAPVKQDESLEILLNELNKFKELYQSALKTNPEASDYNKLLVELQRHKEECSLANERLHGMLEYESKFREAKIKEEQLRVEFNGAERKLSLAEEQLQKALKEKAKIAMEVGKSNDKGMKSHEKLVSMERELNHYKNVCEDSVKRGVETDAQLERVLKERHHLVKQCSELTKEAQENDIELEQLLSAGEEIKSKLDCVTESASNVQEQCVQLTLNNQALLDDLEESNGALAQVKTELARSKRQLNEYKDQADAWEYKGTEGNKKVKQIILEIDEVNEKLDKKSSEVSELMNKLKVCQEQKETVTEELDYLQDKMVGVESQLNRAERERNGQESKRNDLEETMNEHRDEIKKLRKELEEQKSESEKAFRISQDEVMKAKKCLKEMEALDTKYNTSVGKFSELERKYDIVVGERQELRREVLKAESEVIQLQRSLSLVQKEKTELSSEVTGLSSCKNKQDNIVAKLEKELFEVRELYEQQVQRNQEDQVKLKKQSKELEGTVDRMEAKSAHVDELVDRCEVLKQERKELRENVFNIKDQCSRIQSQFDKEFREKENLIDELNEMTRKVKRREEEIEIFERKYVEQGEILERGNKRNREEQGQLRGIKQELDIRTENYEEKCQEFENVKMKYEALLQDYDRKKKDVLNGESTRGVLETRVNKLEREKTDLVLKVTNRDSNMVKQNEGALKLQKQLKEVKENLVGLQQHTDELEEQSKRLNDDNRGLFKQFSEKNSDCVELETNLKELQSSKSSLARELKKSQGKCEDLEKQTESAFREKLKLTEEVKGSEEIRERATSEVNRLKEQAKEYKNLYETNLKDFESRKGSLEKKSLKNEELHKKYSKQAIELSEVEKRLEDAKINNTKLKKECFMKQTKVTKLEELLQNAMQENESFTGIEKELLESQDELQEKTNDIEHLEVEVNTLKLRICDLQASKFSLEKSNDILKASNESERVEESLKKLQELEKDFQKTQLEKAILEERLTEARSVMIEKEAQTKEVIKLGQKLQECEQELTDKEFQLSFLNKENRDLIENVSLLKEKLTGTETEIIRLTAELCQSTKKCGNSRGSLFINNQETEPKCKSDVTSDPLTSTPLNSPRTGGSHSKSFELMNREPHSRLSRKYSLDSSLSTHGRVCHGRLSTSLDNLVFGRDSPRPSSLDVKSSSDQNITNEDVSLDSLDLSEGSMDSLDVRMMIQQIEKSPEGKRASRLAEDWETVSDLSSGASPGDDVLIDLEDDGDVSDTASVKDLKQHFEVQHKPPAKLTWRRSRTSSLTTLVEKHEESTTNPDGSTNPSDVCATTSKASPMSPNIEAIMGFDFIIRENDAVSANAEMTILNNSKDSDPNTKVSTVVPHITDVIPDKAEVIPNRSEVISNRSDNIPNNKSDGITNKFDATPYKSDGSPNNSDGTPNNSDGTPTNSDDTTNNSDDTPNNSDGTTNNSDDTLSNSDGNPSDSGGNPSNADCTPNNADRAPKNADGTPNIADGTPKLRNDIPHISAEISKDSSTKINTEVSNSQLDREALPKVSNSKVFQENKTSQLVVVDSRIKQTINRKVRVQNMKSLWEERDRERRTDVSKNVENALPGYSQPEVTHSRATTEVVIVENDEDEKPTTVSDLVNLFSKS